MDSTNKRVFKNAVALTLRMVLVTIVGLYTSRIVLQALGVEDYGIYGVVGGIVTMASFLNTSMAGATSRFITYAIGKGDSDKLQKIFSTSLLIHLVIALFVVVIAETVGIWFLNTKMVIPPDRMFAANVVFQFSVASVVVGFTQVPYGACIIAHEKMNIYAYFEIVNVVLKLGIVYVLLLVESNRLVIYASLTLLVYLISAIFYRWYCIVKFPEAKFSLQFDRAEAKNMLAYSGFDLYGNMCVVAKGQGQPIILNLFFGVVANAAASIGATVAGTISGLTTTVSQAFRPQIIKQYAAGEVKRMALMMRRSVQFSLLAYSLLAIPFLLETTRILHLWLGQIPPYSVEFLRLIIVVSGISIINTISNVAIHATGNIKGISFISGTMFLLCPVLMYLIMKFMDGPVITGYVVNIVIVSVVIMISFAIINRQIPVMPIGMYALSVLRSILAIAISVTIVWHIKKYVNDALSYEDYDNMWSSLMICSIVFFEGAVTLIPLTFIIAFNKEERSFLLKKVIGFAQKYICFRCAKP